MRIGVEVGGTFTDLVAIDKQGIRVLKVPSTPHNPDEGAFAALLASGVSLGEVEDLAHGSTVATNAVLERKGYLTAFVTTHGFRDILMLQRHGRSNVYDLQYQKPVPVVERSDSFEVTERILSDGSVLKALDTADVESRLIPALRDGRYGALAICLVNSYVNPEHERALAALIHSRLPGLNVTLSSDITREFREYERASTTTLSAYVQPVMDGYIARFGAQLKEAGFKGRFSVMQSNGGRLPADAMRANAITALLSGPAAGVSGAARQAARSGYRQLITLDIGGTSTDVCLVVDGAPQLTNEFSLDGLPVRIPLLDINTVGAGGGSIIWIDDGGMLRVGPESAGASPGPACYGRGGSRPTVTDAHVVRGSIQTDAFLGGKMRIDSELSRKALQPIASHFGMSLEEAADSAIQLANSNIVRAIQVISTERGHDPRDSVLVPYGGAGPLHAVQVAQDLGILTIVVPPNSGVISAYGLLASDFVLFESLTRKARLDENAGAWVRGIFAEMRARAVARAREMQLGDSLAVSFVAAMRFVGQAFEVPVEFPESEMESLTAEQLRNRFGASHQKLFFFGAEASKPIEFVSFRLGLTAPLADIPVLKEPEGLAIKARTIDIYDGRAWHKAQFQGRSSLPLDTAVPGPTLLHDPTSTLLVPVDWQARRDSNDNIILTRTDVELGTVQPKQSSPEGQLDPVDYAVISQGLIAAAREMGVKLIRSAYSTIIREASDASAALFDREGNIVAQAELIPMQLGPMSETFRACAAVYPVEDLREGDFYITNDPYSGGQHLQDVFIYSPVFIDQDLVGFAGTVAHHLDLGGGNPGLTTEAVDVHAEGFIFPPTCYNHARDWEGSGRLKRLVAANIRVPEQTIGDFDAQFAANTVGAARIRQLCEKYGTPTIRQAMRELMDYSESRFRAVIGALPDGVYYGEDAVDDDGITDQPLVVKAKVTVAGDSIHIDFDGTCAQVSRNLNCPLSSTIAAALTAVKSSLTTPDIPFNEGLKKPVRISAPKGSLVNPNYPAPVRARMEAGYRCFNAVLRALSQVVPERVIAGGNDATLVTSLSVQAAGKYRVYLEVYGGGFGASARRNGCDAVDSPLSNCTNTPIEATDMDFEHFRIVGYGLLRDSCGHGKHRGGLGFFRRFEILSDHVNFAMYADRFRIAPYGLFGGTDGTPGRGELLRDGQVIKLKSKDGMMLRKGDILTIYTAGGGGYGPPKERNRADLEYDVKQEFLSAAQAQVVYGPAN